MADGSLGKLFFELGVKENVSNDLNRVLKTIQNADGSISKLRESLKEYEKSLSGKDAENYGKNLKKAINNALDYLGMLQRIERESEKIASLKQLNPGIKTKELEVAEEQLKRIKNDLLDLQKGKKFGGVDNADLTGYQKALRNTINDVKNLQSTFNKENSLSAAKNNAARLSNELEKVKGRLEEIRSLQSYGFRHGIDTTSLLSGGNSLRGVRTRIENMLNDDSLLANGTKVKSLISDIEYAFTKATVKIQEYNREKRKAAEQDSIQTGANRQLKAINDAMLLLQNIDRLKTKNTFGIDTSKLEKAKRDIDSIANEIMNISGSKLTGQGFKDLIAEFGRIKDNAHDAMKEVSRGISKAASDANDAASATRRYNEVLSVIQRKKTELSLLHAKSDELGTTTLPFGRALHEMEAILSIAKSASEEEKRSKTYVAELASEFKVLSNNISGSVTEQQKLNRATESTNLSKTRQANREIEIIKRRLESLLDLKARVNDTRSTSVQLGVDTTKLDMQMSNLLNAYTQLQDILNRLKSGDMTALGELSNIGSGANIKAARDITKEYDRANKKVQEGIELEQKRQLEIAKTVAKVRGELVKSFEQANSHAGKLNSTMQDLKSLFLQGGLVYGAQQFAMSIITTGGEMEKQHIALQSILGDMQNANTIYRQIKELALNSPFTFSELNRDVKQLAAYGVEYDQLYDTTKRLADMSSGLGVSFDRIALAFGQVQARGWLDGKELRQIAYAGIPLLSKLSDFYSKQEGRKVSTSDVKKRISGREVSFEDVKSIFWDMTNAGGQFYNMQQVLSETLLGKYNKLKDAWEIMLADFANGDSLVGKFFKTAIEGVTTLVQSLHTLALPVGTIFAGYAIKKMLAGGLASSFLSNKASLASSLQTRLLQGEKLTQVERNILATKNQITGADLRALASAKALSLVELNRLRIAGKITAEQYNTYRALVLQQTGASTLGTKYKNMLTTLRGLSLSQLKTNFTSIWTGFASSGMAAIRLVGTGIKSLGVTLWSAIGGLPGLIVTGVTFGITYAISKYQELSQKIKQTQDELSDRNKQIREFLRENSIESAISNNDTKEIDNLIESYKEKLKELAPYNFNNLVMKTEEKKSHEERLKYLNEELITLQDAQGLAQKLLKKRGNYSDLEGGIGNVNTFFDNIDVLTGSYIRSGVDKNKARRQAFSTINTSDAVNKLKTHIEVIFGDISTDDELRLAAEQAMTSIFSSIGMPDERANEIRASVLQAFGIGEKDSWLQEEVCSKMLSLIDNTFPEIGAKIRASIPLTEAEQAKVKSLMDDARQGIINKYPELESTLKQMLSASKFQAVIKLLFTSDEKFNDVQSQLVGRIPDFGSSVMFKDIAAKYRRFANSWGKENNWYSARNAAKADIDSAYNEYISAVKSKANDVEEKKHAWITIRDAAKKLLFYDYSGEGKKSNKQPKTRRQEDKELDDLKKRISLYKKMYTEIKKYKDLFGNGALTQLAKDNEFEYIFNNKKLFPIEDYSDYESSIKAILGTLPESTNDRKAFANDARAGIQTENRKILEDDRKEDLKTIGAQLDIIKEQYDTYKKIYELTGDQTGAGMVAFGDAVQFDTYKKLLEDRLASVMDSANKLSGLSYSSKDVSSMDVGKVKKLYGEESSVYYLRKRIQDENNKVQKDTVDLLASVIEKNATIAQQIEDENRSYERQLKLIDGIKDPEMKKRAKEGLDKTHSEKTAQLQFELFKKESDWVTIFDDLDRVSSSTINSMIDKIDEFSRTSGLSVESVKQLRDALDKLRTESINRNPFPTLLNGMGRANAIKNIINANKKAKLDGITISESQAKKTGLRQGYYYSNKQLSDTEKSATNDFSKSLSSLSNKTQALANIMGPVVNLFEALGEQNSILGKITGGASNALSAASQVSGGLNILGLSSLGPYGAAAGAALSVASSLVSAFGADYSSYKKAKEQYDNLTSVWDSLISKKTEYMNIHWGAEATEASKEAQRMLEAEIEQTKIIARQRLSSGASKGSHSIGFRMWSGSYKYNGQNWKDVAPEISKKYGVQFNGMEDLLNMNSETLSKIKQDFTGLWANMDGDFRDYLEKIIEYGEQADEIIESITEKLTGNKFSSLVESWGSAMSQMSNSSDSLVESFEDNLKKAIINSMIENVYGNKIKALIEKTKKYAENGNKITDSNGNVISEYTGAEYADIKESADGLAKEIEATRDLLKKTYGWSDNSSSSSTNSIKGINEEQADLGLSYLNAIRLDVSVIRTEQSKYIPEMNEIAKSQLSQMNMISQNTLRNAEAAERIEAVVVSFNDNFNKVLNGTKKLTVK